jgi:hypothetical protein
LEGVADLAAGQSAGVVLEGGVDLLGERVAGRALQRPGGGAGGVVPQRERGLEVLGVDLAGAVGERVEDGEADRVRFGAGVERAGDSGGLGGRELRLGVVPELARGLIEPHAAGGAGVLDRTAQHSGQAGAGERVGAAAFG